VLRRTLRVAAYAVTLSMLGVSLYGYMALPDYYRGVILDLMALIVPVALISVAAALVGLLAIVTAVSTVIYTIMYIWRRIAARQRTGRLNLAGRLANLL
jgi:hypothetical protein